MKPRREDRERERKWRQTLEFLPASLCVLLYWDFTVEREKYILEPVMRVEENENDRETT